MDFIAITISEVPTAMGIGRPLSRARAGTTRNPPPAPTRPVTRPTASPSARITAIGMRCGHSRISRLLRPRSMAMAVAIIITAKPISRIVPGNELANQAAGVGADHARRTEDQARAPLHPTGACVRDTRRPRW